MNTRPIIQVGIAFVLLGIVAFTYHWGADSVEKNSLLEMASIHPGADPSPSIPTRYVVGAVVLLGGIILIGIGVKKSPD